MDHLSTAEFDVDPLNVSGDIGLLQTCVRADLTGEFFALAVYPVLVQPEVLLLVSLEMALHLTHIAFQ